MIKLSVDPKNPLQFIIKRLDALFPGEPVALELEGIKTSHTMVYLGLGNYVRGCPFMYTKLSHD
jgi:hypothetical protein